MKKKRERVYYMGFSDGKPYVEQYIDTYGPARSVELFASRREARRRFQDVRKVRITESEDAR